MKRIYCVKFDERWSGIGGWNIGEHKVFSNGDAQIAVRKARHIALGQITEGDKGKEHRCVAVRLREVEILAESDI